MGVYMLGPDIGLKLADDKAQKLSLKKPMIDCKLLEGIKVHEIPNFSLCPVKLFNKWHVWCHPEQVHFFHQQASTNILAQYKKEGFEYRTNPVKSTNNVIGKNKTG